MVILVLVNLPTLIKLPFFIAQLGIALVTIALTPFWIYMIGSEAWRWLLSRYRGQPYKSFLFERRPRPTHDLEGSRQWAEAHAAHLQRLVGTVENDMLIDGFEVKRYGWRSWGVVKRWRYAHHPQLGVFGGQFEFLPLQAPPGKRLD